MNSYWICAHARAVASASNFLSFNFPISTKKKIVCSTSFFFHFPFDMEIRQEKSPNFIHKSLNTFEYQEVETWKIICKKKMWEKFHVRCNKIMLPKSSRPMQHNHAAENSISSHHSPKFSQQWLLTIQPKVVSVPKASSTRTSLSEDLSALIFFTSSSKILPNNKCWPFHFQSSKLQFQAKSGFCAEGIEHWNLALWRFCQHFFASLFKNLGTINVDHSNSILPGF